MASFCGERFAAASIRPNPGLFGVIVAFMPHAPAQTGLDQAFRIEPAKP
ncbi:hypothetical protein [Novosphingobium terrae]|nr:hypothetical protein [Novosphingobium terrae]